MYAADEGEADEVELFSRFWETFVASDGRRNV